MFQPAMLPVGMGTPDGLPDPPTGVAGGLGVGAGLGIGEWLGDGVGLGLGLGLGVGEGVGVVPGIEAAKWSMLQPRPLSHDSMPALPGGRGDQSAYVRFHPVGSAVPSFQARTEITAAVLEVRMLVRSQYAVPSAAGKAMLATRVCEPPVTFMMLSSGVPSGESRPAA